MDEDYSNGNSFLDYLNSGGKIATGVLGALNKPKATTPKADATNWGLIAGIGAAVLVVLVLIVSLGGRRA
jgi:hypothetical protein